MKLDATRNAGDTRTMEATANLKQYNAIMSELIDLGVQYGLNLISAHRRPRNRLPACTMVERWTARAIGDDRQVRPNLDAHFRADRALRRSNLYVDFGAGRIRDSDDSHHRRARRGRSRNRLRAPRHAAERLGGHDVAIFAALSGGRSGGRIP